MSRFQYLLEKIESTKFETHPFKHLYIENFFDPEDFSALVSSPEIALAPVQTDEELISTLHASNYKAISFPGTTTDLDAYMKWHKSPASAKHNNQATCEGYGVTMRLKDAQPGSRLAEAYAFFRSDAFWNAAEQKFGLEKGKTRRDIGVQKYLDGYEISPHPDVRLKALTFMINVNPASNSEEIDYHTRYMRFKPKYNYIRELWDSDDKIDRCWVPWGWCDQERMQTLNNSIVIFSPANDTLHAVKASYDHLRTQRTQFYGNLWYLAYETKGAPDFRKLEQMAPVL